MKTAEWQQQRRAVDFIVKLKKHLFYYFTFGQVNTGWEVTFSKLIC